MCHVAPLPESAKFKFKLANEGAVLESANFESSKDKGLAWNHYFLTTLLFGGTSVILFCEYVYFTFCCFVLSFVVSYLTVLL